MWTRLTGLWRHPDFLKLWAGQSISQFGSQVTNLALQLTAVLSLGATAGQLGLLRACTSAPFLLLGLLAGVWIDRRYRRPILIWADLGRALLIGSIPVIALLGSLRIEQLYAVGFLFGALTLFFEVAYQSFLPTLVGRERLVEGNSKLEASAATAQVVGPGLAGGLVQLLTAPLALAVDALSFLISAISLALIRAAEPVPPARSVRRRVRADIGEGLRLVFGHALLRVLILYNILGNLADTMAYTVLVLYLTHDLGWSPLLIGFLVAGGSVGSLCGALAAGRLTRHAGLGAVFVGSALLYTLYLLLLPLASGPLATTLPLLLTAVFLGTFGAVIFRINNQSLRQRITPDRLQGRMSATWRWITWGMYAVGGLLGGALGEFVGVRATLLVAALLSILGFLWILASPLRTLHQPPAPIQDPAVVTNRST